MTRPRELWVTYHGTTESELVVDGATADKGILELYKAICKRESSAWLLKIMGQLPLWWRLVDRVGFKHLADHRDEERRPGDMATQQWEAASPRERMALQRGWRVVQGYAGGGHQIYQLPKNKDPQRIPSALPVEKLDPLETGEVSVLPVRLKESGLIVHERRLIRV